MVLQSVLIPKSKFTLKEAKKWIREHGYKESFYGKDVDITEKFYRFRQAAPKHGEYYVKKLSNGVELINYN